MLQILSISTEMVTLSDGAEYRGVYANSESDRELVQALLSKYGCSDLWTSSILPIWEDRAKVVPHEPMLDFNVLRQQKQSEIKQWCYDAITSGISIDLGLTDNNGVALGSLHYSLPERHQTDMRDLANMISAGATHVTWRDDSRVSHMIYTAAQFMQLYKAMSDHILHCRFRSDGLEELLFSYEKSEEHLIRSLSWDTELPTDIQSKVDTLLSTMLGASLLTVAEV